MAFIRQATCTKALLKLGGHFARNLKTFRVNARANIHIELRTALHFTAFKQRCIGAGKRTNSLANNACNRPTPASVNHRKVPCWRHHYYRHAIGKTQERTRIWCLHKQRIGALLCAFLRGRDVFLTGYLHDVCAMHLKRHH